MPPQSRYPGAGPAHDRKVVQPIARLVEHWTGITSTEGWNPVGGQLFRIASFKYLPCGSLLGFHADSLYIRKHAND